jgi:hypothetical protein
MSATIARLTARATAKTAATKPFVVVRVYGTTPLAASERPREKRAQDFRSNNDNSSNYEYHDSSPFESTLENVLEMAQLGKEQESTSYWEQTVRSAYKRRGISNPMVYI